MAIVRCLKCGKPMEVDAWYLKEIEEGREEQMHDVCPLNKKVKLKKVI